MDLISLLVKKIPEVKGNRSASNITRRSLAHALGTAGMRGDESPITAIGEALVDIFMRIAPDTSSTHPVYLSISHNLLQIAEHVSPQNKNLLTLMENQKSIFEVIRDSRNYEVIRTVIHALNALSNKVEGEALLRASEMVWRIYQEATEMAGGDDP